MKVEALIRAVEVPQVPDENEEIIEVVYRIEYTSPNGTRRNSPIYGPIGAYDAGQRITLTTTAVTS